MIIPLSRPALVVADLGAMPLPITQALRILGRRKVDGAAAVESAINRLRSRS